VVQLTAQGFPLDTSMYSNELVSGLQVESSA
jgi:hypothetical protein